MLSHNSTYAFLGIYDTGIDFYHDANSAPDKLEIDPILHTGHPTGHRTHHRHGVHQPKTT